jgi:acetylornithine deacetylase/succinyl-diaminopimelate desuccinylase-like protein
VEYIAAVLKREGIEPLVLESAPGRGNLVARLAGDGSLPPLLLMGHVDVVLAEADKWQRPPFAGELVDGVVWGRGATDMKQMVAMEMMTLLLLKRRGARLRRDVILMASADEESGGALGAGWIAYHYPELIRAEYAINEGGATCIELEGKSFFVCSTAEKGAARFTLRGRGQTGHASQPHRQNAILPLARALVRLIETPLPVRLTRTACAHVEALAQEVSPPLAAKLRALLDPATCDQALAALPMAEPARLRLNAALRNTAVPTVLRAGARINVIPAEAECRVDCRILPGTTLADIAGEVRAVVGDEVEIDFGTLHAPLEADPASPLFTTIGQVIQEQAGARLVPGLVTGGTDAKRVAPLGTKVYGFVPMRYEGPSMAGLAHNHDERVSVANLEFGTRVLYSVVERFCG